MFCVHLYLCVKPDDGAACFLCLVVRFDAYKTLTKLVHINDGNHAVVHNGDWVFVETAPQTEHIISAFLSAGWTLHSRNYRVTPSNAMDKIAFYLDGWDFLFIKEVPDDAVDNSDHLLDSAVLEAICMNG